MSRKHHSIEHERGNGARATGRAQRYLMDTPLHSAYTSSFTAKQTLLSHLYQTYSSSA